MVSDSDFIRELENSGEPDLDALRAQVLHDAQDLPDLRATSQ